MHPDIPRIIETVSGWEGITAHPHRFGGTEFQLGSVEIGHVHHGGLVDIPFTRATRAALVAAGEAQLHHILPESGWISHYLRAPADTDRALRLYRLSYLHKRSRRNPAPDDSVQMAALGFDASVMATVSRGAQAADASADEEEGE